MTTRSAYEIKINWTEANSDFDGRVFDGLDCFEDFDAFIAAHILPEAPVGGGYVKTSVTIRHIPTGDTWQSRLDVMRDGRDSSLFRHVAGFIRRSLSSNDRYRELVRACCDNDAAKIAEHDASMRLWAIRLGVRLEEQAA